MPFESHFFKFTQTRKMNITIPVAQGYPEIVPVFGLLIRRNDDDNGSMRSVAVCG